MIAEMFTIVHLFMGYQAGSQSKIEAASMFIEGDFTHFWSLDFGLGMVLPAFIYFLALRYKNIPYVIAPFLVLIGGLLFRFVMLDAGQLSRFIY